MFSFARYEGIVIGLLLLISIANVGIRTYVHKRLPDVSIFTVSQVVAAEERGEGGDKGAESDAVMEAVIQEAQDGTDTSSQDAIDLNRATLEELVTLPGIGPTLAMRIIAYRTEVGPFSDVHDLLRVNGIGQKRLESLLPFIKVGNVGE